MRWRCSRKKRIGSKSIEILRIISIGIFAKKLYFNGKGVKGPVVTGILSIIITIFFGGYSVLLFSDIIYWNNYSLDLALINIACLRSNGLNVSTNSIITYALYELYSNNNGKQVVITVAEYSEVINKMSCTFSLIIIRRPLLKNYPNR